MTGSGYSEFDPEVGEAIQTAMRGYMEALGSDSHVPAPGPVDPEPGYRRAFAIGYATSVLMLVEDKLLDPALRSAVTKAARLLEDAS